MSFTTLLIEKKNGVGIATLHRPEALNALNTQMMTELADALDDFERDPAVRVIVITGSGKAFAAGADIKEMASKTYADVFREDFITHRWERASQCRKPVIAAVSGYALGGGCELAMMCDFIIASDTAKFGQPEITLGTLPGIGGSQRLTHLIGSARAMEMCLTGRMIDAMEALATGLVARVVPSADLMAETMKTAEKIAGFSQIAVMAVKEAVNSASQLSLAEGVKFERRLFHASFATHDQKEGMNAFIEKRKPDFKDS